MVFETERLIIRDFNQDDIDLIYNINNDPECIQFNGWDSMSHQDCQRVLNGWIDQYAHKPGIGAFCVESKIDNNKIGMAFIVETKNIGEFEIGFRLRRSQWGNGFAKEIARVFIQYSKDVLEAQSIIAEIYRKNLRSRNVFEKLDFIKSRHPDGDDGLIYRRDLC